MKKLRGQEVPLPTVKLGFASFKNQERILEQDRGLTLKGIINVDPNQVKATVYVLRVSIILDSERVLKLCRGLMVRITPKVASRLLSPSS